MINVENVLGTYSWGLMLLLCLATPLVYNEVLSLSPICVGRMAADHVDKV